MYTHHCFLFTFLDFATMLVFFLQKYDLQIGERYAIKQRIVEVRELIQPCNQSPVITRSHSRYGVISPKLSIVDT